MTARRGATADAARAIARLGLARRSRSRRSNGGNPYAIGRPEGLSYAIATQSPARFFLRRANAVGSLSDFAASICPLAVLTKARAPKHFDFANWRRMKTLWLEAWSRSPERPAGPPCARLRQFCPRTTESASPSPSARVACFPLPQRYHRLHLRDVVMPDIKYAGRPTRNGATSATDRAPSRHRVCPRPQHPDLLPCARFASLQRVPSVAAGTFYLRTQLAETNAYGKSTDRRATRR